MSATNRAGVALDLQTLELFDPGGGRGTGTNRRFCCPLCGLEKPRDAAHRSLIYRTDGGAWNCKRCGQAGKLSDFWETRDDRERFNRSNGATTANGLTGPNWRRAHAQQKRAELSRLLDGSTPNPTTTASGLTGATARDAPAQATEPAKDWRSNLRGLQPLEDTPGAAYLDGRGVPLETAILAGVRFSRDWFGRPSVVFPIRGRDGELVAAQGRRIEATPKGTPNALTTGPKSRGAFVAPAIANGRIWQPFEPNGPGVILCEAPIDALSLAACGFPALALCGINGEATTGPAWLRLACGLKLVFPAFDADDAGDDAARAISDFLSTYGAKCVRLRPAGAKDWNEALQASGRAILGDWIAERVLI